MGCCWHVLQRTVWPSRPNPSCLLEAPQSLFFPYITWCLQASTTLSASALAWMLLGYGVLDHQGPALVGLSRILFSGFQEESNLERVISYITVVCAATAILGVGAAGVRARALCVVMFAVAAVGVLVLARAAWMPVGMLPHMLILLFLSSSGISAEHPLLPSMRLTLLAPYKCCLRPG